MLLMQAQANERSNYVAAWGPAISTNTLLAGLYIYHWPQLCTAPVDHTNLFLRNFALWWRCHNQTWASVDLHCCKPTKISMSPLQRNWQVYLPGFMACAQIISAASIWLVSNWCSPLYGHCMGVIRVSWAWIGYLGTPRYWGLGYIVYATQWRVVHAQDPHLCP